MLKEQCIGVRWGMWESEEETVKEAESIVRYTIAGPWGDTVSRACLTVSALPFQEPLPQQSRIQMFSVCQIWSEWRIRLPKSKLGSRVSREVTMLPAGSG